MEYSAILSVEDIPITGLSMATDMNTSSNVPPAVNCSISGAIQTMTRAATNGAFAATWLTAGTYTVEAARPASAHATSESITLSSAQ